MSRRPLVTLMSRPPWWRPLARARWDDDTRVARALAGLGSWCDFCGSPDHDVIDCRALTRTPPPGCGYRPRPASEARRPTGPTPKPPKGSGGVSPPPER